MSKIKQLLEEQHHNDLMYDVEYAEYLQMLNEETKL